MVINRKLIGHFDGASRGNPGLAGAGAYIEDYDGNVLWETAEFLGTKTNNEAEYSAVILLLKAAAEMGATEIKAVGDSNLVVQQLSRTWSVSEPRLRKLANEAWAASKGMKVTYVWVPREKNKKADELSNRAIDNRTKDQGDAVFWIER